MANCDLGNRLKDVQTDGNQLVGCCDTSLECVNRNSLGGIVGRFINAAIDCRILSANIGKALRGKNRPKGRSKSSIAEHFLIK